MAFPPATLPTNRTNATPQQDTHPSDHNALAAAINDTVQYAQDLRAGNVIMKGAMVYCDGFAIQDVASAATGIRDIMSILQGTTYPYATRVHAVCEFQGGFSAGASLFGVDIWGFTPNTAFGNNAVQVAAAAGQMASFTVVASYPVPAGQSVGWKIRMNVTNAGGGSTHSYGTGATTIYRND